MAVAAGKADPEFDVDLFETRLEALKDSQDGIQQMSLWCMQQRSHHKKIVTSWLNVFKRVRVEQRLTLFYLANDVVQYSKRKGFEFVECWATAIQRATTMVRDEKVKNKILRIFKIWEQRAIYNEEYLGDLIGLLNVKPAKKAHSPVEISEDYQDTVLIANVRECVELSVATDKSFKKLPKAPNCDIESVKHQLKDKSHSEEVENEIERYITYVEAFNKNLHAEIKSRKALISSVNAAIKFYTNQRGDVKVVVGAYKSFGNRIKAVKRKLDEITPNLPSPIPSPDINAPSPEPDTDLQLPDETQSAISVNIFKNNINGYSSYLDGNLPFDINDFKRDEGANKTPSQPIEVIGSRSDDDSFNSSVEYYKPESISVYSSSNNIAIPGLSNPMPVPPVQSEYTSLARAAQQYSNVLPPPNPPLFGNATYSSLMSSYSMPNNYSSNNNETNSYNNGGNAAAGSNLPPLMPPPPMPPMATISGGATVESQPNSSFNSTWDMNMSWSALDNSAASTSAYTPNSGDTPVSPSHFERESHNASSVSIDYSEPVNSLVSAQDVDHRQLHLPPAFNVGVKIGLSKEKTRQLDIDHRNLISLTGSPGTNDTEKKSWLSSQDQDLRIYNIGDVDYRAGIGEAIQTIDTIPMPINNKELPSTSSNAISNLMAPPSSSITKKLQKNSSETLKEDCGNGRYDPTDMVVDMDMSDEDLDDILREAQEEEEKDLNDNSQSLTISDETLHEDSDEIDNDPTRPALLETPPEYVAPNIWETTSSPMNMSGYATQQSMDMQYQQQQQQQQQQQNQQGWNQQMAWNGGNGAANGEMCVPPPPRPPFPMSFQYQNEYVGGRGRGRGWSHSPQFRGARAARGSPYFNRGGRGGNFGMRGAYRGKFRGNNAWI